MEKQSEYKTIDRRVQVAEHPSLPSETSPNAVIMMAMQKGYTPELIEKMMALQERYESNEARKAYHEAMSAFKANPPKILKDKKVGYEHRDGGGSTNYSYAGLAQVAELIGRGLSEHGLSASWMTKQEGNNITVTCTITHKLGHSESTFLTAAPDVSGKKNSIQAVGSTISYLERYTLLALTGLATHDMDDDGKGAGNGEMSAFEKWEISFNEASDAAKTLDDIIQWWPDNGPTIKKEMPKAQAAKIYEMFVARKKELQAKEREPGEEG